MRTYTDEEEKLAKQYNISPSELKRQSMDFLQSEGFFETPRDTIECMTFGDWLDVACRPQKMMVTETESAIIACEQGNICGAS